MCAVKKTCSYSLKIFTADVPDVPIMNHYTKVYPVKCPTDTCWLCGEVFLITAVPPCIHTFITFSLQRNYRPDSQPFILMDSKTNQCVPMRRTASGDTENKDIRAGIIMFRPWCTLFCYIAFFQVCEILIWHLIKHVELLSNQQTCSGTKCSSVGFPHLTFSLVVWETNSI